MTPTTEKKSTPPHQNILESRWLLIIILLGLLLLATSRKTPGYSSDAPTPEKLLVEPSLSPTALSTALATATAKATSTHQPTATQIRELSPTPTATATGTSRPTTTQITASSSNLERTVKVSGFFVNLRAGPGTNFSVVRKLPFGEPLVLLGRLSDNTWLYLNTSDGREGWIKSTWIDLVGINVDHHPVKTPAPFPETTVKVSGFFVNLRTGPATNYPSIRRLPYGEPLELLGRSSDNTWFYVRTSNGEHGWINTSWVSNLVGVHVDHHPVFTPPPTVTSTPVVLVGIEGRWIDIDLSEQRLYAYEGTERVASFLVSTGLPRYPTDTGQYRIDTKLRYSDMRGEDYFLPNVPYTMYYHGDFSIHGTYWHHNFGTPMSHGCVNMDISDSEWLFNWASVGTLVNIHR